MIFFFLGLAYLLGSIPTGFLIAKKVRGIDIRTQGSQNIGATNVFRVVGKPWGILVFFLDALKGYLAVKLPGLLMASTIPMTFSLALGVVALFGHSFPIWLSFRGGKGVATSLGVFLAITLIPTLITFGLWILIFAVTRIISAASLAAAAAFPLIILFTASATEGFRGLLTTSVILTAFIFTTHRANIRRLLRGEEKKLF